MGLPAHLLKFYLSIEVITASIKAVTTTYIPTNQANADQPEPMQNFVPKYPTPANIMVKVPFFTDDIIVIITVGRPTITA